MAKKQKRCIEISPFNGQQCDLISGHLSTVHTIKTESGLIDFYGLGEFIADDTMVKFNSDRPQECD